jgi:CRP-like cAMP-binding protein
MDASPSGAVAPSPETANAATSGTNATLTEAAIHARREQLAKIHVFSTLRAEALELVARVAAEESHPRGAVMFRHGDPGEKLYLILEGKVRITRPITRDGATSDEALATLGAGDVFGEMALLDEAPRSADARVEEAAKLLTIHRDAFEDLIFVHKDLAYEVLWSVVRLLVRRLRDLNDRYTTLSFSAAPGETK